MKFLVIPEFQASISIVGATLGGFVSENSTLDDVRATPAETMSAFGSEVRQLRKARQMTLAELAKASGVSVSHLSAIERGTVNASLPKVSRIAEALSVPEEWFFNRRSGAGPMERSYVVRKQNRRSLDLLYGEPVEKSGYSDRLLSSSIGGDFYMGVSDYSPHSSQVTHHLFQRDGEMHGLVLDGEFELTLEDEVITLRAGDSFSFPGQIVHSARNISDQPARLLWVNSPVIIPKYLDRQHAEHPEETKDTKSGS
ncbi:MAG: helix-turn-helix domain-containing protein [Rhodobacteraceae bacterium]|nr:helix-turn-helix domain-containing protein [Paracoccaceae bacterium]